MNIFDQYGIKEVCDVTIYSIHKKEDGSGDIYYLPALYLDTLKVSTVEKTADNVWAQGGLGNARLINWDFGKEINLTLEDALCTPASLGMCWNGVLSSNWKDGHVEHKVGLEDDIDRLERMEKCFYPRGDRKSISQLLPQTQADSELIVDDGNILTRSEVLDGIEADGFGEVQNKSFRWDLEVDSRIKSIAQVPRKFFDKYGRSHIINKRRTIGVAPFKTLGSVYIATGKIELVEPLKINNSDTETTDSLNNAIINYLNEHHPLATFTGCYAAKTTTNKDTNTKTYSEIKYVKKNTTAYAIETYTTTDNAAKYPTITTTDITEKVPNAEKGYKYYDITVGEYTGDKTTPGTYQIENRVLINVYKDINNVNEDIKYSVYYRINDKEDREYEPYGTVIELDPSYLTEDGVFALIDDARYLQVRVLNDGTYHAGLIFSTNKAPTPTNKNETVFDAISDPIKYPFIDIPINLDSVSASGNYFIDVTKYINMEEFKHIDMWLTFDSLNEMTYYILTKFQDNIRKIIPKSLIGTVQAYKTNTDKNAKGTDNKTEG